MFLVVTLVTQANTDVDASRSIRITDISWVAHETAGIEAIEKLATMAGS